MAVTKKLHVSKAKKQLLCLLALLEINLLPNKTEFTINDLFIGWQWKTLPVSLRMAVGRALFTLSSKPGAIFSPLKKDSEGVQVYIKLMDPVYLDRTELQVPLKLDPVTLRKMILLLCPIPLVEIKSALGEDFSLEDLLEELIEEITIICSMYMGMDDNSPVHNSPVHNSPVHNSPVYIMMIIVRIIHTLIMNLMTFIIEADDDI